MSKNPKPMNPKPVAQEERGAGPDTTKVDETVHAHSSSTDTLDRTLQPSPGVDMSDAPKSNLIAQPVASAKPLDPSTAVPGDDLVMVNAPHAFRLLMTKTGPNSNPVPVRVQFKRGPQWCCRSLLDQKYVQDNGVKLIDRPAAPPAPVQTGEQPPATGSADPNNPNALPVT